MSPWSVRYYRDERGRLPVAEFFEMPSSTGITRAELGRFLRRLEAVREHGLDLIQRKSDVLETLVGESNLYSIQLLNSPNNPRVLACALEAHRCIVLLHAFKELSASAYRRAIPRARRLRDRVVSNPSRYVNGAT